MKDFAQFCLRAIDFAETRGAAPAGFGIEPERLDAIWREFLGRLGGLPSFAENGFAAQMAAPPHAAALLGYFAAMLFNPNNHDARHGAATLELEREAVAELAAMLGLPVTATGHLTSGGSIANLDGLMHVHRRQTGGVAFSADAHHVHRRNCRLMGVEAIEIGCDAHGAMDLDQLESALRRGDVATVIASAGTPGFGAVDAIDELVRLRAHHGFALHVDASYGGFYALLRDDAALQLPAAALAALGQCDSVAIDPHKHGYQPYGCGCVLFATGEGALRQDSRYCDAAPVASVEGSRPGAAAAALWLTLRCLPLAADTGFGPILRDCRQAGLAFAQALEGSGHWCVPVAPQLGVVAFHPRGTLGCGALQDAATTAGLELSLLRIPAPHLGMALDGEAKILRAVFMKPGQLAQVPHFFATLDRLR